jgi:hypothetical protein
MICAYCNRNRAVQTDHLINKNQARRRIEAARERENPRFKVPSCFECNVAKYTLCLVPASHADVVRELEEITGSVYRVWFGDPEVLREVVK